MCGAEGQGHSLSGLDNVDLVVAGNLPSGASMLQAEEKACAKVQRWGERDLQSQSPVTEQPPWESSVSRRETHFADGRLRLREFSVLILQCLKGKAYPCRGVWVGMALA